MRSAFLEVKTDKSAFGIFVSAVYAKKSALSINQISTQSPAKEITSFQATNQED